MGMSMKQLSRMSPEDIQRQGAVNGLKGAIKAEMDWITRYCWGDIMSGDRFVRLGGALENLRERTDRITELLTALKQLEPNNN